MSAEEPPVVFDTVVLSNFAASDSLDWLCGRFRAPRTVGAVERELRRGRTEGYTFVERAIDVIGTEIMVIDADEAVVEQFSKHVDTGEAEAIAAAARLDGIVVTDDGTARELARERDISFTGSVGIIADGVRRGELDAETADRWLSEWIRIAGYYSQSRRSKNSSENHPRKKHHAESRSSGMTDIVRDPEHSDGAPTINDTGIRVINVASAYEHSGYSPDEIVEFYPVLTLEDVHTALAYYYAHIGEFGDIEPESDAAPA